MTIEVFVINLPRSIDRRERTVRQLDALGVKPRVFPAVDGSALDLSSVGAYDSRKAAVYYGSAMTQTEVACCLSHYGVLREIVQRKLPYALVLEDDVEIDADLLTVCKGLVAETRVAWELVRLHAMKGRVRDPRKPRDWGTPVGEVGRQTLYRLNGHPLGAQAYLITYSGAVKMLDYGRRIFLPFDHAMDRFWENGVVPYVVRPFPIRHQESASEIGLRGGAAFARAGGRLRLEQRGRRVMDSLRKRLFNLCLNDACAASALAFVGLGVARNALAASAQLASRDAPLAAATATPEVDFELPMKERMFATA
jgi:glycosyl transferase family 25